MFQSHVNFPFIFLIICFFHINNVTSQGCKDVGVFCQVLRSMCARNEDARKYCPVTCNTCPKISEEFAGACNSSPCANGGVCTESNAMPYYSCKCQLPYYGDTCTKQYCTDVDPCLNGGRCITSRYNPGYRCYCIKGYSGNTCTKSACNSSPCVNGGVCTESNAMPYYSCKCKSPFYDDTCTEKIVEDKNCPDISKTCTYWAKIGRCISGSNKGFMLRYCCRSCKNIQKFADSCSSSPCVNGGVCTESNAMPYYSCKCQSPFYGDNCTERAKPISISTSSSTKSTSKIFVRVSSSFRV